MKKFFIFGAVAAGLMLCTAGFVGYKVYGNATMSYHERLMLQNIEALTQSEDDFIRDEYGCAYWDSVCYAIVVTPSGNYGIDIENRMNH